MRLQQAVFAAAKGGKDNLIPCAPAWTAWLSAAAMRAAVDAGLAVVVAAAMAAAAEAVLAAVAVVVTAPAAPATRPRATGAKRQSGPSSPDKHGNERLVTALAAPVAMDCRIKHDTFG